MNEKCALSGDIYVCHDMNKPMGTLYHGILFHDILYVMTVVASLMDTHKSTHASTHARTSKHT